MSDFNRVLRELRTKAGLTQDELATALGISKSTISMYENGNREPDFETQEVIADFFNIDMNKLHGRFSSFSPDLTEEEQKLLSLFSQLNMEGRSKVFEYMEDIAGNRRYTEEDSELLKADA